MRLAVAGPSVTRTAARTDLDTGLAGLADRWLGVALAGAVLTSAYLSWRPAEILFTLSDILFCAAFLLMIVARRLPLFPFGGLMPVWVVCLAGMLGGMLIGSIVNGDPLRWIVLAVQYCFSFLVLPMLLVGRDPLRTERLFKAAILGVVAMELFGAVVYAMTLEFTPSQLHLGIDFISGSRRLGAFLGDGNWNAAAICSVMPFIFYLAVRERIGAWSARIALAALATGLMLAASVSGFVSAAMSATLFMVISGKRPPLRSVAVLAAASALLLASYGLPKAFEARIAPALTSGDVTEAGTFEGRVELIEQAWAMLEKTQIIGLGADQYRERSPHNVPVHQLYLLLWAEGGLVSLISWLGLLAVLIAGIVKAAGRDRLAAGLGAAVLSTFLFYTTANPHMYARFWIVPLLLAMGPVFASASSTATPRAVANRRIVPAMDRNP